MTRNHGAVWPWLFLPLLVWTPLLHAADADRVRVELKTVEDRVHATVTSPLEEPLPPAGGNSTISAVEEGTLKVAGKSTELVGQGADRAVTTVQKVGTPFFARLFWALDVTKKEDQKQKERME